MSEEGNKAAKEMNVPFINQPSRTLARRNALAFSRVAGLLQCGFEGLRYWSERIPNGEGPRPMTL